MPSLIRRLLMLTLLCPLLLGAAAARACDVAAAAPQEAARPADTRGAHHPSASQAPATPSQPSEQLSCHACSACAGHCQGAVAATRLNLPRPEGTSYPMHTLPAPAGIVLSPEPRPPRA